LGKQKKKQRGTLTQPIDLRHRVGRAIQEGRFQQALDLAKQLFRNEPTPEHRELLHQCYLGRARQLRSQGHTRDAATVLNVALGLGGQRPEWVEELSVELAACGEVRRASELISRIPDGQAQERILGLGVDAALQREAAGKAALPQNLHAEFDRILLAFQQVEKGQDEAVRATLQGIGLHSPFADWKLLIRGLQAYYRNEDARAIENWQRLDPDRLPTRLAAPFRCQIDPAFRDAQPPTTQTSLLRIVSQAQDRAALQQLKRISSTLHGEDSLGTAVRRCETAVALLRNEAPSLVPRLANCLYWAIVADGTSDDTAQYRRVFGAPADDPNFDRLSALVCESSQMKQDAQYYWRDYERWLAKPPPHWPGKQAKIARSLIWCRMAQNAASIPTQEERKRLPAEFLLESADFFQPLHPGAEECFQRSLDLDPELREAYIGFFEYELRRGKKTEAVRIAERLLVRLPDHLPTLEALGNLKIDMGDLAGGLELLARALRVNPLDRRLRAKLCRSHIHCAAKYMESGNYEEARAQYRAALTYRETVNEGIVRALCAACEYKADNRQRAEELIAEARARESNRLPVAYVMLMQSILLKLPRSIKAPFEKEFKDRLREPPTGATAATLATCMASQGGRSKAYRGQRTHEKEVAEYLERALAVPFTDVELEQVCASLHPKTNHKLLLAYAAKGQQLFPANPVFPLVQVQCLLAQGPHRFPPGVVRGLLRRVRDLANQNPNDPKNRGILETISGMENFFGSSSFLGMPDLFDDFEDMEEGWEE
jgi:tetratricopeptide (TPR) repeat protein